MYRLSRRNVIATVTSTSVLLCPHILSAQTLDLSWDDIPTSAPIGEDALFELGAGPVDVDISALAPGEVAVIARPSDDGEFSSTGQVNYVAVLHRTDAQIAAAGDNSRAVATENPAYLVVSLVCPHRGKAVGMTGNPDLPFACTDRGRRHSSVFDAAGAGVSGASDDEELAVPPYTLAGTTLSLG